MKNLVENLVAVLNKRRADLAAKNVMAAVKTVSKAYRISTKSYVEPVLYVGNFEVEVEEFGNNELIELFVSPNQVRRLGHFLKWSGIRVVAKRNTAYKAMIKVSATAEQKAHLQWLLDTTGCKVTFRESGMYVKVRSNPNLRTIQRNTAYGSRKAVKYQSIEVGEKDGELFIDTSIEDMYDGYAIEHLPTMRIGQNHLWSGNSGRLTKNSTRTLMVVKYGLRGSAMLCDIARSMCKRMYVAINNFFETGFAIGYESEENGVTVVRWYDCQKFSFMNEIENGIKAGKILVYEPMFQSPSMTRQSSVLYMNVTNLSLDEIENAINEASAGAYFILKEAYQNKDLPAGKAIKLLSRLSLLMTGSANFGDLQSFAVFYGELSTETEGKSLFNDGGGRLAVQFIRKAMAEKGHPITLEEAYQYYNQGRCGTIKGFNIPVDRRDFVEMARYLLENGIARGIVVLDRTRENAVRVQRNENGEFDNMIIVFGSPYHIDYFGDQTTLKCMFDISKPLEYRLMDMPARPKGHVLTSKQICNVLQFHAKSFEVMKRLGVDTVKAILGDSNDTDEGLELDENGRTIKTDVFTNSEYAVNTITQALPNAADLDPQIRKVVFRGKINAINKAFNRFNFRVKGGNFKVVGDYGGMFGIQLLTDQNEVFVKGKHHDTVKAFDAAAFRHPLVGRGEHGCVSFVDEDIMMKRIDAQIDAYKFVTEKLITITINGKECELKVRPDRSKAKRKAILKRWICNMNPGVAMFASTFPFTVAYYSGMDFDGDMVTLIWEDDVLLIVADLPQTYNEFGKGEASSDTFKFGREAFAKAFLYQFNITDNQNKPVVMNPAIGELAGFNVSLLGAANMLQRKMEAPQLVAGAFK